MTPREQHLDRHVAIQLGIARAVDLAHTARADRGKNFVRADASAGRQIHGTGAL